MNFKLDLLSKADAIRLASMVPGIVAHNRIMVASIGNENQTKSGIILAPTDDSSTLPKQGVAIRMGYLSEDMECYRDIKVGDIITHGIYGGKEVHPNFVAQNEDDEAFINRITSNYKFMVLSMNEVVYIEPNKQ